MKVSITEPDLNHSTGSRPSQKGFGLVPLNGRFSVNTSIHIRPEKTKIKTWAMVKYMKSKKLNLVFNILEIRKFTSTNITGIIEA
jgi:hypothetical protein